jgi:hypothetical protein
MCVPEAFAMEWRLFAVKGFRGLWGNIITIAMLVLLKEGFNF